MGSLTVFVALTWMVTMVLLCSQAAPVTEFFGPPLIVVEDDSNLDYPYPDKFNKVQEMERFHRTYKNGTIEFKMALSNGHVQYQRISSKIVDGDKVQVFEGYISEQYKDGTYGTRYYAADENGYRSSAVIIENDPPKLPSSGPYSSSLPRDIQNQLSSFNHESTTTKQETLIDDLIELEKDLDEQNSVLKIESEIVNNLENEEILEKKKYSEESVLSAVPALGEDSSIGVAAESSTEQPINEAANDADKFEASSELPLLVDVQSVEEESSGRSFDTLITSEVSSEGIEDVKDITEIPIEGVLEASTETLLNEGIASTEQSTTLNNEAQEPNTEVPEINELKTNGELSRNLKYPIEDSELNSNTEADKVETSFGLSVLDDVQSNEEESTEKLIDEVPEISTEALFNDEIASAEQSATFNNEAQEKSTEIPEINELKTNGEKSRNLKYPIEDSELNSSTEADKLETSSGLSVFDNEKSNEQESTGKLIDEVPEASTESLLNDEIASTEQTSSLRTKVPEINEEKLNDKTSRNLKYPLEDSESRSTTLSPADVISSSDEITQDLTEQPSLQVEDKSIESITSAIDSNSDLSTSGLALENETEQSTTLNSVAQESRTGVPELSDDVKTETESSIVPGYPLEGSESGSTTELTADGISNSSDAEEEKKDDTEQPSLEVIEAKSIAESIASENESNSDLHTQSPGFEIDNKSTESNELSTEKSKSAVNTSLLLEDSTNADIEASGEIPNDEGSSISEKAARSFDFLKVLPLPENNLTNNSEGSGMEEATHISTSSEIKDETTTNIIESSTEQPESAEEVSITNTTSGENNNAEAEVTQKNDLEASSSEKSEDGIIEKDYQISTDKPSVLTSSEENSSEENKEKSTEDEKSTELPEGSSEEIENHNTATNTGYSTEAENHSSSDETEAKISEIEIDFQPPVIHF